MLGEQKKVILSIKSRFTLFHSDGCIRVIKVVGEAMHPSCLQWKPMGTVLWVGVCFSFSYLGSSKKKQDNLTMIYRITSFFINKYIFFSYNMDTFQGGFTGHRLWKSSGTIIHHFHSWIDHLDPTEHIWQRRLYTAIIVILLSPIKCWKMKKA